MAVKLAFMTGMRLGEVCGLTTDDVRDVEIERDGVTIRASYLDIRHQYHKTLKRRTQVKDKEVRQVPIAAEVREELDPYMTGPGSYLFSFHPRQETPLTQNRLRDWLYARMESMGISRTDSAGRKKTFHSTRRFFNTLLRHNRVADDVIRRFTGHDSEEMTQHYTDYLAEDLQMISEAQRKLTQAEDKE
jgi:integrase